MLSDNVTQNLKRIEAEQKAQKSAVVLNYGRLALPAEAPEAVWSGSMPEFLPEEGAAFVATFTRTDGIDKTPLVDFAWDYDLATYLYQYLIDLDIYTNVTGRDVRAIDEIHFRESLYGVTSNSVSYIITVDPQTWFYETTLTLTVRGISPVSGEMEIERIV